MPRKADLRTFPRAYMEIAEKARKQERIDPLILPDKKTAKATQLDINRFRSGLGAAGHPAFDGMRDLIMTLTPYTEGRYILSFIPRGLYNLSQELLDKPTLTPLDREGLPEFTQKPEPREDAEDLIKRLYGIKNNDEKQKDEITQEHIEHPPSCPPCDIGEYGVCLKCGEPPK